MEWAISSSWWLVAAQAPPFLAEAAVLLVAGAAIAYLCSRLGLVPIVGFLIAGVVIGPNALGLVRNQALIDGAAELGVILLLFTIGIEFSLERLARIKRLIFGGGGLQVALATSATVGLLVTFGVSWQAAVFTGFLVALSSTAIVLKLLADRGETGESHGQVGLGLLIFQDLGIIAMALLVPILGGGGGATPEIVWALARAALLVALVLTLARRLMPPLLERVARTCSPEIFLLTVVAVCFGTAWLTSLAGVSVSLGAFLAGLIVSESRFSHHAFSEILPLQILFSATFFVSVGMLLDVRFLVHNLPLVAAALAAVLAVKVVTTGVSVLALGYPLPVAVSAALMLAQVGEFSFVLERAGRELGLYPAGMAEVGSQTFIAATVVLMVLTPQLTQLGVWLAGRLAARREAQATAAASHEVQLHDHADLAGHVVVAGYARAARRLVRALAEHRIPLIVTTLSPSGAEEVEAAGLPALRGDSGKAQTLRHAGVERARVLVVADDEPAAAHRVVAVARDLNPEMRIVVRTRSPADVPKLVDAGADIVLSDELESTLQLCVEVLARFDVPADEVAAHAVRVRERVRVGEGATPAGAGGSAPAVARQAAPWIDLEQTVELRPLGDVPCSHLEQIRPVLPSARGCEECLRDGERWVHLRICMTCGHVGCCDASPHRHATAHYHATAHPVARSLERGETWGWCFVDEVTL